MHAFDDGVALSALKSTDREWANKYWYISDVGVSRKPQSIGLLTLSRAHEGMLRSITLGPVYHNKLMYTPAVRSNTLSKLIFASCV